jgi:methionyl-tRNA formyltransferase
VALHKPVTTDEIATVVAQSDLVITIGFGLLLPASILTIPKFGFINLHFSLLPRWRGAAPVQRALEAGDTSTGVTVFQLNAGMDTGPIYTSIPFEISPTINTPELLSELSKLGVSAVLDTLFAIESGVAPTPQLNEGASRADKLNSDEAQIDWSQDSVSIVN